MERDTKSIPLLHIEYSPIPNQLNENHVSNVTTIEIPPPLINENDTKIKRMNRSEFTLLCVITSVLISIFGLVTFKIDNTFTRPSNYLTFTDSPFYSFGFESIFIILYIVFYGISFHKIVCDRRRFRFVFSFIITLIIYLTNYMLNYAYNVRGVYIILLNILLFVTLVYQMFMIKCNTRLLTLPLMIQTIMSLYNGIILSS